MLFPAVLSYERKQIAVARIFAVSLLLAVLVGCDASGDGRQGFQRPPAIVAVTPASIRTLTDSLEAVGTAKANESVTITAKVTDTVSEVRFDDGDVAIAGQILVEMTNEEESALLTEARANVRDAETQYLRLADLLTQQSIPVSQVDEAKARFDAAVARQASIEARLQDRLIKAPFGGLLGFRNVSAGTLLTATTPITTLDDIAIIKLDFSLPEIHVGKIKVGQEVIATSDAYPEKEFPAAIQTIGSRIDPVTRAVTVRAHVDNQANMLRPGMLLKVQVMLDRKPVLMVPNSALQQRGDSVFVFLFDEGKAKMQEITIGARQNSWAEVTSGLQEGQVIISQGVIKVRDNSPVRLQGEAGMQPGGNPEQRRGPGQGPGQGNRRPS